MIQRLERFRLDREFMSHFLNKCDVFNKPLRLYWIYSDKTIILVSKMPIVLR